MTFEDAVRVLRERWISVVLVTLAVAAAVYGVAMSAKPVFSTSALVTLNVKSGGSAGQLADALVYAKSQSVAYAELARTPVILDPVRKKLGPDYSVESLGSLVTVTSAEDTASLYVWATSSDPEEVVRIANAVAEQVVKAVGKFGPPGSEDVLDPQLTRPATTPTQPISPSLPQSLLIAAAAGLALGFGQAFVRAALYTRIKSSDDVARAVSAPVIGEIPWERHAATLDINGDRFSPRAEAYRRVRTNLQFLLLDAPRKGFVVTSSVPGEGKTTTAVNSALLLAESHKRVLLIDADLRRPTVSTVLGLDGERGLTTVLAGEADLADVVQTSGALDVLVSGPQPPNPAELLGSDAMKRLLDDAFASHDVVVIDSPPLLPVVDSAVLAQLVSGAVVVAASGGVSRRQLAGALRGLQAVQAPVLGVVLNKVRGSAGGYYHYRYEYGRRARDGANLRGRGGDARRAAEVPVETGPSGGE